VRIGDTGVSWLRPIAANRYEHLLRAAGRVIDADQIIVVGSPAFLATVPEFMLLPEATMSVEADLIPLDGTEVLADRIDGATGLCPEIDDLWLTKLAAGARP